MASATFEDHPTDPDKVILRKKPYLDKGRDYEEGFVDGMQHQMQSSVDKAVNRMAQPEQEPVAWYYKEGLERGVSLKQETFKWIPLYTTPPQRNPLTHEQRFDLLTKFEPHKNKWEAPAILIDMVEAAHNIKE